MLNDVLTSLHRQLQAKIYVNSYYEFFKWAFYILHPGDRLEDNFHIKYLCDIIQEQQERMERREVKGRDLIINIPPRTSKSLICSVCYVAWAWLRDPTIKFICVSFDDKLSLMNAQMCRDLIQSNQYQALFKDKFSLRADVNAKSFFFNNKGGGRISKTTGSNVTGLTGKVIVLDDPQNPQTVQQAIERTKTNYFYSNSLYNRLTPVDLGFRMLVMQRLHQEDLTGYLLSASPQNYHHICLPAEIGLGPIQPDYLAEKYTDGLLDPVRLNKSILTAFKATLGSLGFAGQYGQSPASPEGSIIKRNWIPIIEPFQVNRNTVSEPVNVYVDPAYTMNTANDPSGLLASFKRDNRAFVLEATEKWMEFTELCRFIPEFAHRHGYGTNSKIVIEPKASGKSIVQHLRSTTRLNVVEGKSPDKDKLSRTTANTPMIESGRLVCVNGPYVEAYINQLCTFPLASHDDMLDVTNMALDDVYEGNPAVVWM